MVARDAHPIHPLGTVCANMYNSSENILEVPKKYETCENDILPVGILCHFVFLRIIEKVE